MNHNDLAFAHKYRQWYLLEPNQNRQARRLT